jgi:hypothetical protein
MAPSIIDLLQNLTEAEAMGARARHVFQQQAGATGRCVEALRELILTEATVKEPA